MADADSVNFVHKYLGQIVVSIGAGVGMLVLWALKAMGSKVLDQYVTKDTLHQILKEHSKSVAESRQKEQQALEDRIVLRILTALNEGGLNGAIQSDKHRPS